MFFIKNLTEKLLENEYKPIANFYSSKNIDENKRSIAYSLTFGTPDRTLSDDEINAILENIINDLENKGIQIRR